MTNKYYLKLAEANAELSPDPSRKTGCVIVMPNDAQGRTVIVHGNNHFPQGVKPRLEKPEKYTYIEHAERNAIYAAAKTGTPLAGGTIFLTWYPCADCARAIVQSGIKRLVGHEPDWSEERYGFKEAQIILGEGGVETIFEEK